MGFVTPSEHCALLIWEKGLSNLKLQQFVTRSIPNEIPQEGMQLFTKKPAENWIVLSIFQQDKFQTLIK